MIENHIQTDHPGEHNESAWGDKSPDTFIEVGLYGDQQRLEKFEAIIFR